MSEITSLISIYAHFLILYMQVVKTLEESKECIPVFDATLKFMYTGNIKLTDDNIYPILQLADKYIITELKDICVKFILQGIPPHNIKKALDILCYSETFNVPAIVEKCLSILANYFQQMTHKYLQRFNLKQFTKLISRDDVVVNDEFMLFKKVDHWYTTSVDNGDIINPMDDEDVRNSYKDLLSLLSEIRFEHMTPSQLREARSMKLGAYVQEHHPEVSRSSSILLKGHSLIQASSFNGINK